MRELAVQSSSETLANSERAYIQDEFSELTKEVDRIAAVTEFNGIALGNGDKSSLAVQVGAQNTANDRLVSLSETFEHPPLVWTTREQVSNSIPLRTHERRLPKSIRL